MNIAEELARRFHDIYERLAPKFGYETRKDTREFDPESPNGRLMIAVCEELQPTLRVPGLIDTLIELDERVQKNRKWAAKFGPESPIVKNDIQPMIALLMSLRHQLIALHSERECWARRFPDFEYRNLLIAKKWIAPEDRVGV